MIPESERKPNERYCNQCLQILDETEHSLLYYCSICRDYIKLEDSLDEKGMRQKESQILKEIEGGE